MKPQQLIVCMGLALSLVNLPIHSHAQTAPNINAQQLGSQYRTVADILSLIEQIKPDPERIKAYREQLTAPLPPADAYWFTKRDALLKRMDAAEALGDIQVRVRSADAIMAIFRERKDRPREMEYAFSYAGIIRDAGRSAEAFAIEEEMSRDPQSYAHWVMSYHNRRGGTFSENGNVEAAKPHLDAANIEFRRHQSYTTMPNTASANAYLNATFKRAQGKFVEAEALYLTALKESQRMVNSIAFVSGSAKHALPGTSLYSGYLGYRLGYARMLMDMGRVQKAERVVREPLLWALERTGKYSPHAVRGAAAYATVLMAQGRYVEAEKLALASIEMAEGIGAEAQSRFMRDAQRALARALMAQGRAVEADAQFKKVSIDDGFIESPRALAAILNGRSETVTEALRAQSERSVASMGASNPLAGEARGLYAMSLASQPDAASQQQALALLREATPSILKARQQSGVADDALRAQLRQLILSSYLQLLAHQAKSGDQGAVSDSFALADWLRGSGTQAAVAASAARAAAGDSQLAQLVRREQDMRTELIGLHRSMLRLSSLSPEQLKASVEDPAALRARIDALTREHSGLFADLSKRFPKYANLIDPQPPTLAETQRSLRTGEVLVSILTTPKQSYVWALPASGAASFHVSQLGEAEIAPIVRRLRNALDVGDKEPSRWEAFDVAASHRLHRELLAPVNAALKDAHTLVLTSNGTLAGLPPAVLVTREHTLGAERGMPFERYVTVPWLAKEIATAQVPSVNAWVSLRNQTASPASKAFTGFGDPVFAPQAAVSPTSTRGMRAAVFERPSEQTLRANQAVGWKPYSKLAQLPDTRDEVLAMAKALGADVQRDVVLGAEVTKQRVMQTDLSTSRVIAFATHGLLAGDFQGVDQPSLALSVPAGKDADKEPVLALLTLDDVLQLKLNADWVVLSACNTAASDGQGAEAVSGLGRGFFYAGTRALLVTHWAVDSESAKDLVSHIFNAYAKEPQLTRARALQGAMNHIMGSQTKDQASGQLYSLAHPLFWAPYALIGEAGR